MVQATFYGGPTPGLQELIGVELGSADRVNGYQLHDIGRLPDSPVLIGYYDEQFRLGRFKDAITTDPTDSATEEMARKGLWDRLDAAVTAVQGELVTDPDLTEPEDPENADITEMTCLAWAIIPVGENLTDDRWTVL